MTYRYKKALLPQGNRAMPQLFFSVQSTLTTFTTSLRIAKLQKHRAVKSRLGPEG